MRKPEEKNLVIKQNEEYQLHIVEINDRLNKDFFYDTYKKAFHEVDKIIKENKSSKKLLESANNIIAFCGDRGQGKSSAMLSFSKLLKEIEQSKTYFDESIKDLYGKHFFVLQRIDPTELEKNHSILSVILAKIFFEFKKVLENRELLDTALRNAIIRNFKRCFQDVGVIKNEHRNEPIEYEFEDDIEKLSQLSDAANIKKDFSDLVRAFLMLRFEDKENSYLIIQIDDADLNIQNAYEIVEDIRKYFMMPNVIVLMAMNIKLLTRGIEQSFNQKFSSFDQGDERLNKDVNKMAAQYIYKLLPGSRRINLPTFNPLDKEPSNRETIVTYQVIRPDGRGFVSLDYYDKNNNRIGELQEFVLRLIFEKTGLVFVKRDDKIHEIIPKNTRALVNLLSVLYEMPNIKEQELIQTENINDLLISKIYTEAVQQDYIEQRINNLRQFENYFIETWVKENLECRDFLWIEEWLDLSFDERNRFLQTVVFREFAVEEEDSSNKKGKNTKEPVNFYEVLYLLTQQEDKRIRNVSFAFRTLYDIMLNILLCKYLKGREFSSNSDGSNDAVDAVLQMFTSFFQKSISNNTIITDQYNRSIKIPVEYRINQNELSGLLSTQPTEPDECYLTRNALVAGLLFNEPKSILKTEYSLYTNVSFFIVRLFALDDKIWAFDSRTSASVKSNVKDCYKNDKRLRVEQISSFIILSNLEVLFELLLSYRKKSNGITPFECYKRILQLYKAIIGKMDYYPIEDYSYNWFSEQLNKAKNMVEKAFSLRLSERDINARLQNTINMLTEIPVKVEATELINRIEQLKSVLVFVTESYPIDLEYEIEELNKPLKNYRNKKNPWSEKTQTTYRQRVNNLIKNAIQKIRKYINE